MLVGRLARRFCLAALLLLFIFTTGVRIRSVVLTRRISAVLSGLAQVRVDQTTEGQLLKSVPDLVLQGEYPRDGSVERHYEAGVSNKDDRQWRWSLAQTRLIRLLCPWPRSSERGLGYGEEPIDLMSFPFKLAYWLGWRCISFNAWVMVDNGTVSQVGYGIDKDMEGWPRDPFIFARSSMASGLIMA
jgi:hypothetical protein